MQRAGGFKSGQDGRGLHVTKMPENDNKANLTDLTIRTSAFMSNSERKGGVGTDFDHDGAAVVPIDDEESGGYAA